MRSIWIWVFLSMFYISSCRVLRTGNDDHKIEIIFVQVNDVYEIAPLADGKVGGMARVATLKKQYKKNNPNTFLVMAGDFVSPSVYNSLQYQGKRIRGKQMIESMNTAGMDIAVFGNHEFDITEQELQERIDESEFQWVSSNTFHKVSANTAAFKKSGISIPETYILTVHDADGTTARIGFIGLTIPFNKADYVTYTDPLATAKKLYAQIRDSCDAVVAVTHQFIEDDVKLADAIPGLAVILGGHEHDMRFRKEGKIFITKAHANARSAYVVRVQVNTKNKKIKVIPVLKELDESVPLDSATNYVVQKWIHIADQNYSSLGFDSKKVVIASGVPLDGRESEVRIHQTNLTRLIVESMLYACPQADIAIVNGGSIRVDDILQAPITEYDIIRALPFGGPIREVEMKGRLLVQVLDAGRKNMGIGGFLHYTPVIFDSSEAQWKLQGSLIDPVKTYRVAIADFLIGGKETNLGFLNKDNPDLSKIYPVEDSSANPKSDIRLAVIQYLENKK